MNRVGRSGRLTGNPGLENGLSNRTLAGPVEAARAVNVEVINADTDESEIDPVLGAPLAEVFRGHTALKPLVRESLLARTAEWRMKNSE